MQIQGKIFSSYSYQTCGKIWFHCDMNVDAWQAGLIILQTDELIESVKLTQNGAGNKKHAVGNSYENDGQNDSCSQEGYGSSNNHSLYLWWAVKHLRACVTLRYMGLQQQETASGTTHVIQEQESKATVGTGFLKLHCWRLEKHDLVLFQCVISVFSAFL